MATFKIAHIKEQGTNVIIVPLTPSFGKRDDAARQHIIDLLQDAAVQASLRGRVIPMWQERDAAHYVAPPDWIPFFKTLKWKIVMRNLNRELDCPLADALGVNPNLDGTEGMGMFEKLGTWLIKTLKDTMAAISANPGGRGRR